MKNLTIQQIHDDLVAGKYSCEQLVTERLALAKENALNASVLVFEKEALEQAKLVDQKLQAKQEIGLLEWIPFGVKDTFLVEWTVATGAAQILENYISPYTATAVQRLLDAGAILIVKENCDAFGHGSSTENTMHGSTKNAIDQTLVAGGSSGGSAANVAAWVTVFSLGEDTGGSIRQPAGYNKVYGHKVSYGMVSRYGCMAYASSLDTIWPIANSPEDLQTILDTIAGKDAHDLATLIYESQPIKALKNLKVWYYKTFFDTPAIDPEIKQAFMDIFAKLKDQGVELIELPFFDDKLLVATYYTLAMAETSSNLSRIDGIKYGHRVDEHDLVSLYLDSRWAWFSDETKRRIVVGNQVLSQGFLDKYYQKALVARNQLIQKFANDFTKVDIIISPVTPNKVPKIGAVMDDALMMYMSDVYTVGFSLGKLPTLTIPGGLPTGMQITGAYWTDTDLLEVGKKIEKLIH